MARAEVAQVIFVGAVSDCFKSAYFSQLLHVVEQLFFAKVATVGVVSNVGGVFEFAGFDELMPQPSFGDEP